MKTRETKTTIYTFDDMQVYVIFGVTKVDIYVKYEGDDRAMYFSFGTSLETFADINIEELHDVGYFDDLDYCQEAVDFMTGGADNE